MDAAPLRSLRDPARKGDEDTALERPVHQLGLAARELADG